ncbi:MAG: NEW3 domain-containing protein, partial [Verrucomicrobiales bacterium]|nr:NEW3 domain-containing protein [Verrucomicrobiales bacterium]
MKEQGIEHVAVQFRADLPLVAGEANDVRLQLHNTGAAVEGELKLQAPAEWIIEPAQRRVQSAAGASTTIDLRVTPPDGQRADTNLTATFIANGQSFQAVAKLHPLPRARVTRLTTTPALDGTDR